MSVHPTSEWWRSWFGPSYLALYDDELALRTATEIDELEALLRLSPPARILDLPCGQGRHSIELARRGYEVTGADLSPFMLSVAQARAREQRIALRFLQADMRQPLRETPFDLALNLFTSLGYFEDQADDVKAVASAAAALRPGGRFMLEVVNGERLMRNFQEREWFTVGDAAVLERRTLDRTTRRMTVERMVERNAEEEVSVHVIRLYGPEDIKALLRAGGFGAIDLYGEWDGSPATPDASRVLAVATAR